MTKLNSMAAIAAAVAVLAAGAAGQLAELPSVGGGAEKDVLTTRVVLSHVRVAPGETLHVAVELSIADGHWVYGPAAGGAEIPVTDLAVRVGEGPLAAGAALFGPTVEHVTELPGGAAEVNKVYEGKTVIFVPVTVPADAAAGESKLDLTITSQACWSDGCLPPTDTPISATIVVGGASVPAADWTGELAFALAAAKTVEQWRAATPAVPAAVTMDWTVGTALAVAFLAGLILNIMPCVLPVIPLKILSLVQQAGESRRRFRTLGLAFVAGIILFFVGLAGLSVALKTAVGYTLKWGDMFQYSAFIYVLVLVLTAFAANMFGAFTVLVPRGVAAAEGGEGHLGSVWMGFLTAVLSTPCSFAILGSAFLWAQSQSSLALGVVGIIMIGVGMGSPYVVLTLLPALVARIPRAGRWTELFKQSVGFVLLGVAVWLLSTQMSESGPAWVAGYAVVLAMCLWAWGTWIRFDASALRKWGVRGGAAAVAVLAGLWMLSPPDPLAVTFQPFDRAAITQAREDGRVVLVDFTAKWCLTCKAVEKMVYDDQAVAEDLIRRGVLVMQGDVTHRGSPADKMLSKELGEPGVPVTVIFPPGDREPIRLRGFDVVGGLSDALTQAQTDQADEGASSRPAQ